MVGTGIAILEFAPFSLPPFCELSGGFGTSTRHPSFGLSAGMIFFMHFLHIFPGDMCVYLGG